MNTMVKPISMYCHGCGDIKFYNTPCACTGVAQLQWADSAKTFRPVDVKFPGTATYVDGPRIGQAAEPDPWVKVGTTTIDGTVAQVGGHMLNGGKPSTLRHDTIEDFIDGRVRSQEPIQVGGRWLRLVGSHINSHAGTALIRCDIVRRQSEIEAETHLRPCAHCEEPSETQFCESCVEGFRAMEPPCPECGPHGKRGEVLLASSWAKCTTCAGGKPGDLWGEVQAEPSLPTGTVRRSHNKESPDLSGPLTVTIGGRDFKVPTISEMHGAALDNLYRYLCGEPGGMSREEYRRIMFGETEVQVPGGHTVVKCVYDGLDAYASSLVGSHVALVGERPQESHGGMADACSTARVLCRLLDLWSPMWPPSRSDLPASANLAALLAALDAPPPHRISWDGWLEEPERGGLVWARGKFKGQPAHRDAYVLDLPRRPTGLEDKTWWCSQHTADILSGLRPMAVAR